MRSSYYVGEVALITTEPPFTDDTVTPPVPKNPTSVVLAVSLNGGAPVQWTWTAAGGDPTGTIQSKGAGLFVAELQLAANAVFAQPEGTWSAQWVGTGVVPAISDPITFLVVDPALAWH